MLLMAFATDYRILALGVAIAGVSPGLAYTPISGTVRQNELETGRAVS
jgi:hypothetical protein